MLMRPPSRGRPHRDHEGVANLLGVGAAADVEEVGRLAAGQLDDAVVAWQAARSPCSRCCRRGGCSSAKLRGFDLERVLAEVARIADVGVAVGVVVEFILASSEQIRLVTASGLTSSSDESVAR
jgi:hypothetical protein